MGFWDALASAGPYANNAHFAPDMEITTPTSFTVGLGSKCII